MKKYLLLALLFFTVTANSQNCDCKVNFDWMKKMIEENDTEFQYMLDTKGQEAYEYLNRSIADKIAKAKTYEDCKGVMKEWLNFFRRFHLNIWPTDSIQKLSDSLQLSTYRQLFKNVSRDSIRNHEKIIMSDEQLEHYLKNIKEPGIEGLWNFPPFYKVAIIKNGKGYTGFIVDGPSGVPLQKGSVKLKIYREQNNQYTAKIYGADLSVHDGNTVTLYERKYMRVGNFNFIKIEPLYPESAQKQKYYDYLQSRIPLFERLSANTVYLRLPSFAINQKRNIDSILNANDRVIKSTPNLIIDIRNNGGGADDSYHELLKYIYTTPLREMSVEYRSTQLNNKSFLEYSKDSAFDESDRKYFKSLYEKLNSNIGKFVLADSNTVAIDSLSNIYTNPKNVAILINGNTGSSAEQFVIDFRQSRKVKIYGQSTLGSIDFSNTNVVNSPNNEFWLQYATSKSLRIPKYKIDETGVQPDYFIDDSISPVDWIPFVKNLLEGR